MMNSVLRSQSIVAFVLFVMTALCAPMAEATETAQDLMATNLDNWRIFVQMKEISPAHPITVAVESALIAETGFFSPLQAYQNCANVACQAQATESFLASLPEYLDELESIYKLQGEIESGEHEMSLEYRTLWYELVGIDRTEMETAIAQLRALQTQINNSTNSTQSTAAVSSPLPSIADPQYRKELVQGTSFMVGSANGVEVWTTMVCRNSSCTKTSAYVFVRNNRGRSFNFAPKANITLTAYDGTGTQAIVETFSPKEWTDKQENKAAWKAVGAGLMVGLANSGSSGTYSGTYSSSYSSGSYYGSYTDYDQKRANIARDSEYYVNRINQAFQNNTVGLLWAETLSPGEDIGGQVFFRKFKNSMTSVRMSVNAGGQTFHFDWGV